MYLARHHNGDYVIRESVERPGGWRSRDVMTIGPDPAAHLHFPSPTAYYLDPDLAEEIERRASHYDEAQLDRLFFRFLPPGLQARIKQFEGRGRGSAKKIPKTVRAERQSQVHPFDKRRLYFLRYGQMNLGAALLKPYPCYDQVVQKSRDEIEWLITGLETVLKFRERKAYVYAAFDLQRFFPNNPLKFMPAGLDPEAVDDRFVEELCRLGRDRGFVSENYRIDRLSDYLVKYLIMYFDSEFEDHRPEADFLEDFINQHRVYRPPAPKGPSLARACRIMGLSEAQYKGLDKKGLTRVYRRLVMACHPDRGGDQERFIQVKEAFTRLVQIKRN
ncbi:MAG: J domain-containing protein [Proteobacteria bacterium]|nr:J domain-containing protein [Pseudomonadota bacterium]MBU1740425.1 J domain-containing protein [Pseudomonadota bacterium]